MVRILMSSYRAYLVDNEGHIKSSRDVTADDDAGALDEARQYVDGHDVEVWDRDRRIGILKRDRERERRPN